MAQVKTIPDWLADRGLAVAAVVAASGLERRVVEAIAAGRYTPSPEQRRALAAAIGIGVEEVAWGHQSAVEHIQGHGPQFGRSP